MVKFGVMQGRLLPKLNGRYQAHPTGYWQDEFELASSFLLDVIEFIVDIDDIEKNPLMTIEGLNAINAEADRTKVRVESICADFLMDVPLHSVQSDNSKIAKCYLNRLVDSASSIGVTNIVIPCVDQSALRSSKDKSRLCDALYEMRPLLKDRNITLALETDLSPKSFKQLLQDIDNDEISVNYDIGNSAALGFNPIDEFTAYGDRITNVHIKDRTLNGGSVLLGSGNANFPLIFAELAAMDYSGLLIMQAYRDDEGVRLFSKQLEWIRPFAKRYLKDHQ